MPEVETRLRAALTGRYDIERALGHGGMATVYLEMRTEFPPTSAST